MGVRTNLTLVLAVFTVCGVITALRCKSAAAVSAAAAPAQSGRPVADTGQVTPAAVVVELFTSEGCSSCPPADDLLRRIAGTRTDNGAKVIALSEHVTYWNNLGWADPYSSETFTNRQSSYADRLSLQGVYTPQMVVDGRTQFVGSDAGGLQQALRASAQQPHVALAIDSLQQAGGALAVRWHTAGQLPARLDLWAAVTDDADQTVVRRGENGGRTLQHAAVVRTLMRIDPPADQHEGTARVTLPPAVLRNPERARHVVLFLQEPGLGPIRGAATRALVEPAATAPGR